MILLYVFTRIFDLSYYGVALSMLIVNMFNMFTVMIYLWKYAEEKVHPFAFSWDRLLKKE